MPNHQTGVVRDLSSQELVEQILVDNKVDSASSENPWAEPNSNHPAAPAVHSASEPQQTRALLGTASDSEDSEDLEMRDWSHDDEEPQAGPGKVHQKRTRRRTVSSLADRVVMEQTRDGERVISKEERKQADEKVLRNMAINACFIGLWYLFSLLISIYNKWMFSPDHLNFKFPLFTTCTHMLIQFTLSSLVLFAFPSLRPANAAASYHQLHRDMSQEHTESNERRKQQSGQMTRWFYLTRIGPCGAATGLDIGLGNMSLKFITLAFYTMCKSSSLAFVLIFAFIFGLEKPTFRLIIIITVMTIGVIMMVASEAKFVLIGFILVITASALSGLRWALTQVLLVRNPATSNPFSTIFFLAPVMFVSILAVAIPVEGFGPLFTRFGELVQEWGLFGALGVMLFPGVIAFLMVSSEFALLQRTSVVTLSICGIFKEVMTISAAAMVFHDPLTPVNISGLAITIISIGAYNYFKIQNMRNEAVNEVEVEGHHGTHHRGAYSAILTREEDEVREENIPPAAVPIPLEEGEESADYASSSESGEEFAHGETERLNKKKKSSKKNSKPGVKDAISGNTRQESSRGAQS